MHTVGPNAFDPSFPIASTSRSPRLVGTFVDAARYMPAQMAAAYEDPSVIEKLDPPKLPRARMHCLDYIALP